MDHYTDLTIERKREILQQIPIESKLLAVRGGQLRVCSFTGRSKEKDKNDTYHVRFQTAIYDRGIDFIEIPHETYAKFIADIILKDEKQKADWSLS